MTPKPRPRHNTSKDIGKATTSTIEKATTSTPSATNKKRTLSPDIATAISSSSKKNKQCELSTMDLEGLKCLINASTEKIENKIETSHSMLESKLNDLAVKVKDDVSALQSTVVEFHSKINDELNDVKTQLSKYSERIDNNDDDFQRTQRNQDLRITGFEHKEGENLHHLFKQIAAAIGVEIGPNTVLPSIERMSLFNKTTQKHTPSKTILVHFAILRQKQQFYAQYLSKMPLDPTKFGLSTDNRIVIGENLTKKNAQVFKQALSMKKTNEIAQA